METGDLISFYRKQAGMTIDELVEKSGVPKGTLNKIIAGITKAPTLDNMKAIARALGKTLADFDDFPIESKKDPAPINVDAVDNTFLAIQKHNISDLQFLSDALNQLNDDGREKLLDYAADLVASGRHAKKQLPVFGQKNTAAARSGDRMEAVSASAEEEAAVLPAPPDGSDI